MTHPRTSPLRSGLALVAFLGLTFVAPALGSLTLPDAWYASLRKPSWNPPGWVFGPVWTLLYTLMAVAAWRVWRRGGWAAQRGPLVAYGIQLVLNAAWTPLFFGAHAIGWALVDILALGLAVGFTMRAFLRVDHAAGLLLLPYLAWVAFATVLNGTLGWMNRG